jgi:hypothetical protein
MESKIAAFTTGLSVSSKLLSFNFLLFYPVHSATIFGFISNRLIAVSEKTENLPPILGLCDKIFIEFFFAKLNKALSLFSVIQQILSFISWILFFLIKC